MPPNWFALDPWVVQIGLLLFLVSGLYIVLIRPQLTRQSAHVAMLHTLRPGDRVVLNGGVVGTIRSNPSNALWSLVIAPGVEIEIEATGIERRLHSS